ncbi:hypothetical protein GS433_18900 [Rhodococcus hoagii]|uniref:hypothetical protein n=1 Tax=Rhodococcus hoagii TaxID=43767 RepID=UPI00111C8307|nr:hypothetical protein [Prescottella equi]MBM4536462.1 hypothetical protein [Prescottella equi]NKR85483.1 hypothetical protein [Prescottella equi]
MTSTPPWAFIVTAAVAAAVAVIGWFAVNKITNKRELQNWRRTTLLQAVSSLIEASLSRYDAVHESGPITDSYSAPSVIREADRKMVSAQYQILICRADGVSKFADAIIQLHSQSNSAIEKLRTSYGSGAYGPIRLLSDEEVWDYEKRAYIEANRLKWNHDELIKELQVEIKLRKEEFDPAHTQVDHLQHPPKIRNK